MAEPFANIQLDGMDRLQRALRRIQALGGDMDGLLGAAGDAARDVIIGRFDREQGPGGIPWPKSKRALGEVPNARGKKVPGKTLTDTGDLRNSLTVAQQPGRVEVGFRGLRNPAKAPANQFGASDTSVVRAHVRTVRQAFGIPLPQPKTVNVRGHSRINNLPARPMLGLDEEMSKNIGEVTRLFLLDLMVRL